MVQPIFSQYNVPKNCSIDYNSYFITALLLIIATKKFNWLPKILQKAVQNESNERKQGEEEKTKRVEVFDVVERIRTADQWCRKRQLHQQPSLAAPASIVRVILDFDVDVSLLSGDEVVPVNGERPLRVQRQVFNR